MHNWQGKKNIHMSIAVINLKCAIKMSEVEKKRITVVFFFHADEGEGDWCMKPGIRRQGEPDRGGLLSLHWHWTVKD